MRDALQRRLDHYALRLEETRRMRGLAYTAAAQAIFEQEIDKLELSIAKVLFELRFAPPEPDLGDPSGPAGAKELSDLLDNKTAGG
jgi:hypothetical protein